MVYTTEIRGTPNTLNFRMFFRRNGDAISPFHDIPYIADLENRIYNMVVEVPRWSNAKLEIATKEPLNPIKQDIKNGKLRYVKNCFPHHGYIWNYGAIPQTWENPSHIDEITQSRGDNDPIDVCEIGDKIHSRGEVIQVKILGILGLLDEGETDWKVIAIDINDSLAPSLNNIDDVETHKRGLLKATAEWFKIYKIPEGKPLNKLAFEGKFKDKDFAEKKIEETHVFWQKLITSPPEEGININALNLTNATILNSPYRTTDANNIILASPPATEPAQCSSEEQTTIDKWHVITL